LRQFAKAVDAGHTGCEKTVRTVSYNPFTKEQAILMMADSVEAASRSLKEYTEESISGLVDKIIDSQVQEGYFKECPITFKDIATVKSVFKEKLKTMYHTRISYPELKK
jgi:cyclic-di-AMP phosphodiesterase PgpH